jgi:hypothetical protein
MNNPDLTASAFQQARQYCDKCFMTLLVGGLLMAGYGSLIGPFLPLGIADAMLSMEQKRNPETIRLVQEALAVGQKSSNYFIFFFGFVVAIVSYKGLTTVRKLAPSDSTLNSSTTHH